MRRPYYSEIQRDMPVEMFLSLCRLLCNFPEFREPYFYNVENKKAKVISFTHLPLVKYFLSRLSGKSMEEVAEYFERTLCAQRKGHITKVIVSPVKDFSLIYNFRKGQLTVSYTTMVNGIHLDFSSTIVCFKCNGQVYIYKKMAFFVE